jgi:hypothetical protein
MNRDPKVFAVAQSVPEDAWCIVPNCRKRAPADEAFCARHRSTSASPSPANDDLARLIKTRLLGVAPDSQDLVLEDRDWLRIIAALEGVRE